MLSETFIKGYDLGQPWLKNHGGHDGIAAFGFKLQPLGHGGYGERLVDGNLLPEGQLTYHLHEGQSSLEVGDKFELPNSGHKMCQVVQIQELPPEDHSSRRGPEANVATSWIYLIKPLAEMGI